MSELFKIFISQLKDIVFSFVNFGVTEAAGENFVDLRPFVIVLPESGDFLVSEAA